MHTKSRFYEDYELGSSRTSTGRTITETDIVMHAGQTGDFFPHHMDEAWCSTQPFGHRIAHGTLVFSVAIGQTATEINPEAFSKGYDRLRFVKPVFIGDTIHTVVTISALNEDKKPGYGIVTEHVEVFNQTGSLVLVCDHLLVARKKNNPAQ
jgi:acyl dehydratase